MNPSFRHTVVTLVVLFPLQVTAYPNGKVEAACVGMIPNHGFPAQNSSAPYSLTMSKTSYLAGEKITVTLQNTSQEYPIEGFLIQARELDSNTPLGSFQISGSEVQTLTCTTAASAVSHTSDNTKTSVEVTWIAPRKNISNIQLRATVVRNASIFWTNVAGPSLTYAGSGGSHIMASLCITYISILFRILLTFFTQFLKQLNEDLKIITFGWRNIQESRIISIHLNPQDRDT